MPFGLETRGLRAGGQLAYPASFLGRVVSLNQVLGSYRLHGNNGHSSGERDVDKALSGIERTNAYLNDFLARLGRTERVNLDSNLQYRRERFFRRGGGLWAAAAAVARLIVGWPLYSPGQRAKFLARFLAKAALGRGRSR